MSRRRPALLPIFRSEQQLRLLGHLYMHAGAALSISDLGRRTGIPQQTISREVERLVRAGLLTSRSMGRMKIISANEDSPYFSDLRGLLLKAVGPAAVIGEHLRRIGEIEEAFIFGSWARRYEGEVGPPPADVDVLVIGSASSDDVSEACRAAERGLGLQVNPVVLSRREWESQDSGFIRGLRKGSLVPLLGRAA